MSVWAYDCTDAGRLRSLTDAGEGLLLDPDDLIPGPLGVRKEVALLAVAVLVGPGHPAIDRDPTAPILLYQINPPAEVSL